MLSKEEIEKAKERINNLGKSIQANCKEKSNMATSIGTLLQYIEQLEFEIQAQEKEHKYDVKEVDQQVLEKQKLIDKLKTDIEEFRKEMNLTSIKLNQLHYMKRIEYAKEIIEMLEGGNFMTPKIEQIKTYTEEQIKKLTLEELQTKFLELQEIAKDGNIIIQKQQYQIHLDQKQIDEMKKAITIKDREIKDLQAKYINY